MVHVIKAKCMYIYFCFVCLFVSIWVTECWFTWSVFHELLTIFVYTSSPCGFKDSMWDLGKSLSFSFIMRFFHERLFVLCVLPTRLFFCFEGRISDLIVNQVSDHCLSFTFLRQKMQV